MWRTTGEAPITIELGAYDEALRRFLLGETGFPRDVVLLIVICTERVAQESFYSPNLGFRGAYRTFTFDAKGINFFMSAGKQMPERLRKLCTITGADRWIYVRNCEEKVTKALHRLLAQQK